MNRSGWIVVGLLVAIFAVGTEQGGAARAASPAWKGAETLNPLSLAPAPLRCGPPPTYLEGRFAGSGLDSVGGAFTVTASGCLDTEKLRLFDMEATDTFVSSGDSIVILPGDVDLVLNADTCVAVNRRPVPFRTGSATGSLQGASGQGTFHIALSYPPCGGALLPAHVWFDGTLHVPR